MIYLTAVVAVCLTSLGSWRQFRSDDSEELR